MLVDVPQLVALLVDIAEDAGDICQQVVASGDLGVVDKGGEVSVSGDYVADAQTEADRRVEAAALEALGRHFPEVWVIAEESAETSRPPPPRAPGSPPPPPVVPRTAAAAAAAAAPWPDARVAADRVVVFVDPLDGTGEFAAGNLPVVTNLFGVAVDGVPVAGVVNQPFLPEEGGGGRGGRTVWGGPGVGVHGLPAGREVLPSPPPLVVGTNRVVRDARIPGALEAVGADEVHLVSASGWQLMSVVEGSCHLVLVCRSGTKKWDTVAGEALLAADGGVLTDAGGRRYDYRGDAYLNLCGVLAARDPGVHARALAALGPELGEWPWCVDDPSVIDSE